MQREHIIRNPNPYAMAVLTAILAALSALIGTYFTARFQMEQYSIEYTTNMRRSAYTTFLERLNSDNSPVLSPMLNIGSMARHVSTDGEIQQLEDTFYRLLTESSAPDLYWQLNSELRIIQLNGSEDVRMISNDLLKCLALRHWEIEYAKYPETIQAYHIGLVDSNENGAVIGWNARLSPDERISLLLLTRLFEHLVDTMREELDLL